MCARQFELNWIWTLLTAKPSIADSPTATWKKTRKLCICLCGGSFGPNIRLHISKLFGNKFSHSESIFLHTYNDRIWTKANYSSITFSFGSSAFWLLSMHHHRPKSSHSHKIEHDVFMPHKLCTHICCRICSSSHPYTHRVSEIRLLRNTIRWKENRRPHRTSNWFWYILMGQKPFAAIVIFYFARIEVI